MVAKKQSRTAQPVCAVEDPSVQILSSRTITPDEESKLRAAISHWANRIPHHPHRDMGDLISISTATFIPVYRLGLRSLHENRQIDARQEPYRGGSVPNASTKVVDSWTLSLPAQTAFESKTVEHRLEQTYEVSPCGGCNAQGILVCGNCSGTGDLICAGCLGRREKKCSWCSGGGLCDMCGRTGWRNGEKCLTCNGRGMCNHCKGSGTETCTSCWGSGRVKCDRCNGVGQMQCGKCAGTCKLLDFQVCIRRFTVQAATKTICRQTIPNQLGSIIASSQEYSRAANSVGNFDHSLAARIADPGLQHSAQSLMSDPKKLPRRGESVVFRQLELEFLPVYHVEYDLDDESFEIFLHSSRLHVHAPRSPISEVGQELETTASKNAASGSHREALENAIKAIEINPSSRKARDVIAKIQSMLMACGILGAFLATVAATMLAYAMSHDVKSVIGSVIGGLIGFGIVCLPWFRAASSVGSRVLIGALMAFGPSITLGFMFASQMSILALVAIGVGWGIVFAVGDALFDMPKLRNLGVGAPRRAPLKRGGQSRR